MRQRNRNRGQHSVAHTDFQLLTVVDTGSRHDNPVGAGLRHLNAVVHPLTLHLLLEKNLLLHLLPLGVVR